MTIGNDNHSFDDLLLVLADRLEKQEIDLPPLPHVASQVLALTTNPNADAMQLTTLIEQDPILTAKIFQTTNSQLVERAGRLNPYPKRWRGSG